MQRKKHNERTIVDESLENQDVAIDIITNEEVSEEVPSSSRKPVSATRSPPKKILQHVRLKEKD